MKVNVSMLPAYKYCPRKLFFQYVLKIEEIPKEAVIKGSIKHHVFDGMNNAEERILKGIESYKEFKEILGMYQKSHTLLLRNSIIQFKKELGGLNIEMADVFNSILPIVLNESGERALNTFNFIQDKNIFGDELWEKIVPKMQSEVSVASEIMKLAGRVDKIEIFPDRIVPVEIKSGAAPDDGVWPGHNLQIAAYSMLLEEKFGRQIQGGIVHYIDKNAKRFVGINPFLRQEVADVRDEILKILESKAMPEQCANKNKCGSCALKKECDKC